MFFCTNKKRISKAITLQMIQIYIEKLKSLVRRKGFIISHTFNITKLLSKKKRKAEVHL
jgi:hypothetical protein